MATTPVSITSQVFFKKRFIYPSQAKPILPPPVASSQWFQAWSTPVRQRIVPALAVALAASGGVLPPPSARTVVAPATITSDVIYPRSFIYQAKTQPTFVPAPAPVIPTFFNLTQGDIGLVFQKTLIYQVNTDPIGVTAPFVYEPWSEPTRRTGLSVALQPSFAWSNFTPAAAPVTDVKWSYPWSEPVRTRRMPVADMAPSQIQTIQPPTILVSQWYEPWVDPVRLKTGLPATLQQSLAWSNFTPPVVVTADIRWIYPWSEPVRTRTFGAYLQDTGAPDVPLPPTVLISQWYEPWVDPVRLKPGLSVALHQTLAWSGFTPAVAVTDIRWSYGWTEPVRVKRGLPTGQQPFLAFIPLITNASNNAAPYYPWSEPVRQKVGLRTHLQSFTSLVTPPAPNFIRTINWYAPWAEPVRQKKGMRPWYQQEFAFGTPRVTSTVTLTMSAFEINLDQFLAGVIVSDEPPPPLPAAVVAANVSIEEIPLVSGAATSIEET